MHEQFGSDEQEEKRSMIQLDLFDNPKNRMEYAEFIKHLNFEWFKKMEPLRKEDCQIIDEFYNLEYDAFNPPLYLGDPINASIEGRTNVKWIVVELDDDVILVVYKTFQFMSRDIMHVFDKPISRNRSAAHEQMIIDHFRLTGFVSFIFKEKYSKPYRNVKPKSIYDDYYYDLAVDEKERFSNRKWLKNARINKIVSDGSDYSFKVVDGRGLKGMKNEFLECRRIWWEGMGLESKDTGRRHIENTIPLNEGRIVNFCLFYKNKLLAYSTEIVHFDNHYSVCLFLSHIGRSKGKIVKEISGINERILSNLDDCIRYVSGTWLLSNGIKREYCLGYRPSEKRLKNHKEVTTAGAIRYYIGN